MMQAPRTNLHVIGYDCARDMLREFLLEFEAALREELRDASITEGGKMAAVGALDFVKDAMAQLQL